MDSSKRILVTGAAGFIGSHIVDGLLKSGYTNVYGVDDLSGGSMDNVSIKSFYKIDLSQPFAAKYLIENCKPDIIFHLAANAREGASGFQPLDVCQRNYLAYISLLEPAIKNNLDKVILFSSMAVYGNHAVPFTENNRRDPVDVYGINKAAMEHTTEVLSKIHDFRYTIIRPHNVFGEGQCLRDPYRNVIGIFMNRIMNKMPLYIYGDGKQERAFSYIYNSLPCYLNAINRADFKIVNIGGLVPVTIDYIKDLVLDAMGEPPGTYPCKHLDPRVNEVKYAYTSYELSQKLLGYEEKIGLLEGIRRMALWAKSKGPQKWKRDNLELLNDKAPITWRNRGIYNV